MFVSRLSVFMSCLPYYIRSVICASSIIYSLPYHMEYYVSCNNCVTVVMMHNCSLCIISMLKFNGIESLRLALKV